MARLRVEQLGEFGMAGSDNFFESVLEMDM